MRSLKAALYYEYKKIFSSMTLADIRNWDDFIERLIAITIEVTNEQKKKRRE